MKSSVSEGFITLNRLSCHYLEWGNDGAPVLLLLHGGWQSAADWSPVADALAGRYRVLAFDQRGHGRSDWTADYRLERFVEDLDSFVDRFRLDRFALLGFSWGGAVAYFYAARRPEVLTSLVLVDIGPDWSDVMRPRVRPGQIVEPLPPTDPAYRMPELFDFYPPQAAHWPLFSRITCPTWLLRAARSNRLSSATAARILAALPAGRLVEIPDSGHLVLRDNPDDFLAVVRRIL